MKTYLFGIFYNGHLFRIAEYNSYREAVINNPRFCIAYLHDYSRCF